MEDVGVDQPLDVVLVFFGQLLRVPERCGHDARLPPRGSLVEFVAEHRRPVRLRDDEAVAMRTTGGLASGFVGGLPAPGRLPPRAISLIVFKRSEFRSDDRGLQATRMKGPDGSL